MADEKQIIEEESIEEEPILSSDSGNFETDFNTFVTGEYAFTKIVMKLGDKTWSLSDNSDLNKEDFQPLIDSVNPNSSTKPFNTKDYTVNGKPAHKLTASNVLRTAVYLLLTNDDDKETNRKKLHDDDDDNDWFKETGDDNIKAGSWGKGTNRKKPVPSFSWNGKAYYVRESATCSTALKAFADNLDFIVEFYGGLCEKPVTEGLNQLDQFTEELGRLIRSGTGQIVLTGAPGTGKTYTAQQIARAFVSGREDPKDRNRLYEYYSDKSINKDPALLKRLDKTISRLLRDQEPYNDETLKRKYEGQEDDKKDLLRSEDIRTIAAAVYPEADGNQLKCFWQDAKEILDAAADVIGAKLGDNKLLNSFINVDVDSDSEAKASLCKLIGQLKPTDKIREGKNYEKYIKERRRGVGILKKDYASILEKVKYEESELSSADGFWNDVAEIVKTVDSASIESASDNFAEKLGNNKLYDRCCGNDEDGDEEIPSISKLSQLLFKNYRKGMSEKEIEACYMGDPATENQLSRDEINRIAASLYEAEESEETREKQVDSFWRDVERMRGRIALIQFHPSYDYTDFVEGLRPVEVKKEDGSSGMEFRRVDGSFMRFCRYVQWRNEKENSTDRKYFFIIDEINRADISKVMGELMYGLESDKRNKPIITQYSNLKTWFRDDPRVEFSKPEYKPENLNNLSGKKKAAYEAYADSRLEYYYSCFDDGFRIPPNVVVIGTMNDIDRSVESMDFAMRRRFVWKDVEVTKDSLMQAFQNGECFNELIKDDKRKDVETMIANGVVAFNESAIHGTLKLSSGYDIAQGHFFDIKDYSVKEGLRDKKKLAESIMDWVWNNRVGPLLREYLRGEEQKAAENTLDTVKGLWRPKQPEGQNEAIKILKDELKSIFEDSRYCIGDTSDKVSEPIAKLIYNANAELHKIYPRCSYEIDPECFTSIPKSWFNPDDKADDAVSFNADNIMRIVENVWNYRVVWELTKQNVVPDTLQKTWMDNNLIQQLQSYLQPKDQKTK